MLKCFAVFSKAMPKSLIPKLHAFKCILYCFPVVAGVLNDNDKEGFYNYTLLMHVTVSAVFAGVFIDNDKGGFEIYTLFNACYSAALCL